MATNLGVLHVDELYVAGRRVDGDAAPVAPPSPVAQPVVAVPDSEATNTKALVADFNALLEALRVAGVIGGAE